MLFLQLYFEFDLGILFSRLSPGVEYFLQLYLENGLEVRFLTRLQNRKLQMPISACFRN